MTAITGAILAGGRSERMGQPKQDLLLPDGRTMVEHVAEAMQGVCSEVVIVGEAAALAELRRIGDARDHAGPLGGIEALLLSGIDSRGQYLVCACDVPLVTGALLQRLIAETFWVATVFQIEGEGRFEPLPALITLEALPAVQAMLDNGERALWKLLEHLQPHRVEVPRPCSAQLANINTTQDLARLR